jgi:hypothetical protein
MPVKIVARTETETVERAPNRSSAKMSAKFRHAIISVRAVVMSRNITEQLLNPRPGSAVAAALEFGIDLTLLSRKLLLTPEERLAELQLVMDDLEEGREQVTQTRLVRENGGDQTPAGHSTTG